MSSITVQKPCLKHSAAHGSMATSCSSPAHARHGTRRNSNLHSHAPHLLAAPHAQGPQGRVSSAHAICFMSSAHPPVCLSARVPQSCRSPISAGASLLALSTTTSSVRHAPRQHGRISDHSDQSGKGIPVSARDPNTTARLIPISAIRDTAPRSGTRQH